MLRTVLAVVILTCATEAARAQDAGQNPDISDRSYFGILRVKEIASKNDGNLIQGGILQGMNFSRLAKTYYHRRGPVGAVMEMFDWFGVQEKEKKKRPEQAEDAIQQGKILKLDARTGKLSLAVPAVRPNGEEYSKQIDLTAVEETKYLDADGQPIKDGLADARFKTGVQVQFKSAVSDGQNLLAGIRLVPKVVNAGQASRGQIKKVDADKGVLVVTTTDGKEVALTATEETRYLAEGDKIENGLSDPRFKAGAQVLFKSLAKDGKNLLIGVVVGVKEQDAAPDRIQQGKIKKVDAKNGVLTIVTAAGKDLDLMTFEDTRFMGPDGQPVKEGLSDPRFKEGAAVMFKAVTRDGKSLLIGVRIVGKGFDGFKEFRKPDTSRLKPLTEMGEEKYQGFAGGLYPGGKNERPAGHEQAGLAIAKTVQPLNAEGKPDPNGKVVLISVGMSNTTQVFSAFKRLADLDEEKNPSLLIVDCAQGGQTAFRIQDPDGQGQQFWTVVDKKLEQAGLTRAQVQAVWIKEADAGPTQGFPKYAQTLQAELADIVRIFPKRFPNTKLVYLSSRTYGGYAKTPLNPDPYAFESGFAVKWLIEQQIQGDKSLNFDAAKGPVTAPWLNWGPYLWANGTTKRADGYFYEETDFAGDGTHPSMQGQRKVARELLRFFKNDSTAKSWFMK